MNDDKSDIRNDKNEVDNSPNKWNLSRRDLLKITSGAVAGSILSSLGFGIAYNIHQHNIEHPQIHIPKKPYLGKDIKIKPEHKDLRPGEKAIVDSAIDILPRSAPHIDDIVSAVHAYEPIFPVPLEIAISLFNTESGYRANVRSSCFALGIAQFMRDTAIQEPFKMEVYTEKTHKELYDLETTITSLNKSIAARESEWSALEKTKKYRELSKSINKFIKEYQKQIVERNILQKEYDVFFEASITPENEERINVPLSIRNGIWYKALLASEAREIYGGGVRINTIRALSAYNAGPEKSQRNPEGISTNNETISHIEKTTTMASRIINPEGWLNTGKEAVSYAKQHQENKKRQDST